MTLISFPVMSWDKNYPGTLLPLSQVNGRYLTVIESTHNSIASAFIYEVSVRGAEARLRLRVHNYDVVDYSADARAVHTSELAGSCIANNSPPSNPAVYLIYLKCNFRAGGQNVSITLSPHDPLNSNGTFTMTVEDPRPLAVGFGNY